MQPGHVKDVTLGPLLLGYMFFMILLVTLVPFQFELPGYYRFVMVGPPGDLLGNVLLFMPLGFLAALTGFFPERYLLSSSLCTGFIFSMAIEYLQFYLPLRHPSFSDVVANGSGCLAGAIAFSFVRKHIGEGKMVKVLSLNLPLAGSVYLLIPLMWLHLYSWSGGLFNLLMAFLPTGAAAVAVSSIYVNRFEKKRLPFFPGVPAFMSVWVLVATFPILFRDPVSVVVLCVLNCCLVTFASMAMGFEGRKEHRFEIFTLKLVLPVYCFFLLLLFADPMGLQLAGFRVRPWLNPVEGGYRAYGFRFPELIAGFTLLGYMFGELFSRHGKFKSELWAAPSLVLAFAVFVEVCRGFHLQYDFSLLELVLITSVGWFGVALHDSATRRIRKLSP